MSKAQKRNNNKHKFLEYIQKHSKFKKDFVAEYRSPLCEERYGVTKIRNVLINYKIFEEKEEVTEETA